MHPNNSLGDVGQPSLGVTLGQDAFGSSEDHRAIADILRQRLDLFVKIKVLSLYLPMRHAALKKPPFRLSLRFFPTHPARMGMLTTTAS